MSSRHNRSLRSLIAIALACFYMLVAAGAPAALAHERPESPCHGHGVSGFIVDNHSDAHSRVTQSDRGAIAGHLDSACQFCSAIVSDAGPIALRLVAIAAAFEDGCSSFSGQPPARLSRPPRSILAL